MDPALRFPGEPVKRSSSRQLEKASTSFPVNNPRSSGSRWSNMLFLLPTIFVVWSLNSSRSLSYTQALVYKLFSLICPCMMEFSSTLESSTNSWTFRVEFSKTMSLYLPKSFPIISLWYWLRQISHHKISSLHAYRLPHALKPFRGFVEEHFERRCLAWRPLLLLERRLNRQKAFITDYRKTGIVIYSVSGTLVRSVEWRVCIEYRCTFYG